MLSNTALTTTTNVVENQESENHIQNHLSSVVENFMGAERRQRIVRRPRQLQHANHQPNNHSQARNANHQPNGVVTIPQPPREVAKWLGRRLRLELVDGRMVRGTFVLTDNAPNIVLTHADEWWADAEQSNDSQENGNSNLNSTRLIGSVMIRGDHNFLALCGTDKYNNCVFHRVVKGFIVQTGDPTNSGKGGQSIWNEPFADELHEDLSFDARGVLAMASNGPNTNKSQFFITCAKHTSIDGKYTIFGKMIDGFDTLEELENLKVNASYRPVVEQRIKSITIHANPIADLSAAN